MTKAKNDCILELQTRIEQISVVKSTSIHRKLPPTPHVCVQWCRFRKFVEKIKAKTGLKTMTATKMKFGFGKALDCKKN